MSPNEPLEQPERPEQPEPDVQAITQGENLGGRFVLGDLLGVGGSASVFRATDLSSDGRGVALKVLHPHLCADDATRQAFAREVRQAGRLDHPNIARVHDAGLHDVGGLVMPWIALDLVAGPSLAEWVTARGPLSAAAASRVMLGLLDGLQHAHDAGLVHRDLSPHNVLLDLGPRPDGPIDDSFLTADVVRLADFGLADVTGRTTVGSDVLLTDPEPGDAAATVVGHADFMSPEQARGLPVRSVSDLYQAGAVLYFALTGQAPFPRNSTAEVLTAHVVAPPPAPSAIAPAAGSLDRIVARALAKTPAHRFRSASEFAADVRRALPPAGGTGVTEVVPSTGPSTKVVGTPVVVPLGYLSSPAGAADSTDWSGTGGTRNGVWVLVAGAVIVTLGLVGAFAASADDGFERPRPEVVADDPTPTVTDAPAEEEEVVPEVEPTASVVEEGDSEEVIATVSVPALWGSLAAAERALGEAGLRLGTVSRVDSSEPAERILSQSPAAGQALAEGSVVDITIASGRNAVPDLADMSLAAATAIAESAGFVVATDRPDAPATARVTGSQPGAGTVLKIGVTVILVLEPTTEPAP